ncbi:MAG: GAF domain-containing protein, partial [Chloroflexota bacterium]
MDAAGLNLVIGFLIAGTALVLFVFFVTVQVLPRLHPVAQPKQVPPEYREPPNTVEAVFAVQPGGRVDYINVLARNFFDLRETEPYDLERLARRARPADDFLSVCASPGQKRVSINGRMVEITSYQVPGAYPLILVSLRPVDFSPAFEGRGTEASASVLKVVTDFSQSIAASLDLETTIRSILENVSRIVHADVLELKLWDPAEQSLIPYRLQQDAFSSKIARVAQSQFGSLTSALMTKKAALLVPATRSQPELLASGELLTVQSYLGLPLIAGGELVGMLEAGQVGGGAFGQHDLDLLQLVAGQAAVVVRNARLYEAEQRRSSEMAGLAHLNQSFGLIHDPQDLFAQLVESVAPLFEADIVGFLLYDEENRTLEARIPFHGLPAHFVQIYRASVPAESPAERVLTGQQPVLTLNAASDENWQALGLTDIATAASLRDSAFVPLLSAGRTMGYLQVAHHRRGVSSFSTDELRLMNIVANQAAAIIENVLLVQQARGRAQRADALRRIASLCTSSATLAEILKFSVQELAHLFLADAGVVFLMDEERGELHMNMASLYGVSDEVAAQFTQIYVDDAEYRFTVSGSQRPFVSGRLSSDRRVISIYQSLKSALQMESALVVPLVARDRSIGELMIGSRKTDFFNENDLQVASSAAVQIASAVDSAGLIVQTDASLRRRVDQLMAVSRVSRELSASLDIKHVLQTLHDEGLRAIHADCASVLLLDQQSTMTEPGVVLAVGCAKVFELTALERGALQSGELRVVEDFAQESIFPPHEGVRSALVVPLVHQGNSYGLIHLHSSEPEFFTPEKTETVQSLAIQAGIALNHALRYQSERQRAELMRRRAETLVKLTDVSYNLGFDQPLEQALQSVARGIKDSTPFSVVLVSLLEPDTGLLKRVTAVGIPQETLNDLMARKQPYSALQQLMRPEFKISRSYFVPADETPVLPAEVHYMYVSDSGPQPPTTPQNAWDPDDFLLIPLENTEGKPLGLISLDNPSDGLRPDLAAIEAIEVFAAQAAQLISYAARFNELRGRIDSLGAGLQRQQKLLDVSQNYLPVLLHKDLEQTISLQNLERRAQRVRAGLAITESVSLQLDATSALNALGRETLTQLNMSIALVAENTPEGPRLLHVMGSLPRATNVEALFGQRNPLRTCLQTGNLIVSANVDEDDEWRDAPLLTAVRAKSMICLPIIVEGRMVAAMLSVSPEPMTILTDEDRQVFSQIARQASVILQNISLLNETRRRLQEVDLLLDFSRLLSGLDPDAIVRALLDNALRVIQAAHAGVILLWNTQSETLGPRAVSGYADSNSMIMISYRSGEALPGLVFARKAARRVDEVNFARDYNLSPENLAIYREATGGRLPVSSLLVPILAGEQCLGLLVLDNFNTPAAFLPEDEILLTSLAQQVALSLENVRLVETTRERAGQLQALNDAAASLTSSLRSDQLVSSLLDQLSAILPYDTATLWLRERDRLMVAAARGFTDTEERLGLSVSVADSALFKEMAQTGQAISIGDVRQDSRFPAVEAPHLSWIGIPLISKGELAGVLALEKWQAHFYSSDQLQVALTFASQAAVSLENARLYEDSLSRATELDQRSQRLGLLNRFSSSLSGLLDADQILHLTAEELLNALGVQRISVVTFERGQAFWNLSTPRARAKLPKPLSDAPIFSRLRESLGVFNTDDARREPDLAPLKEMIGDTTIALLILPLASGSHLRALIFAQMTSGERFNLNEIELARTITNQAAIALENARLYQSTAKTAERFAILNETSSQVSASLDPEQIYVAVHRAAERLMPVQSFVISLLDQEKDEIEGVYLVDGQTRSPITRIPKDRGLSGTVISTGQPLLLHGAENVDDAGGVTFGEAATPLSILAVPMTLGGKTLGMLSAQSYRANVYTEEDQQILGTLANQAIVAIQNGRLFAETQRLAQELEKRVIERTAQLRREQQSTETLLRILTEVSSSLDLDRALNRTLSLLNEAIGAEQGTIMLLSAQDNLLHYRAGYGYLSERAEDGGRGFTLKIGEGLAGWVVQHREATLINDLHRDPRWVRSTPSGQDHRSAIVVPMLVSEDVIGVLMVFHRVERFFSAEMLNLVKAIASQVAVAINNAHLYELIRDQAERLGVMLRKEQEDASRSQAILEAVADGVLVTGADNRITFVNSSTERIL